MKTRHACWALAVLLVYGACAGTLHQRFGFPAPEAAALAALAPVTAWLLFRLLGLDRRSRERRRLLGYRIDELDRMDGHAFEDWAVAMLSLEGFAVETTPPRGDFGIDVVATYRGVRVGVEVKRRSRPLGNEIVRSALGGCIFYGCHAAAIVTQSTFTAAAKTQAAEADRPVLLYDRSGLSSWAEALARACERLPSERAPSGSRR